MDREETRDSVDPNMKVWDEFVRRANDLIESGNLERWENRYKRDVALDFARARTAVLNDNENWASLVKSARTANLIHPIQKAKFRDWIDLSPSDVFNALQEIWTEDNSSVAQRIRAFCKLFSRSVIGGKGTRMNVVSVLLMGIDVRRYPPFMITVFNDAYECIGYEQPPRDADEATLYEHALGFLDQLIKKASAHGVTLRHRLDAQSILWQILREEEDE